MSQTIETEPYVRHDANPQCEHRLNPDTVEFVSREEGRLEIEGTCLDCPSHLYKPLSVGEMSAYERGGW